VGGRIKQSTVEVVAVISGNQVPGAGVGNRREKPEVGDAAVFDSEDVAEGAYCAKE
jgi:hypothetical protein